MKLTCYYSHSIILKNRRTYSNGDGTSRPSSPEFSGWTEPARYKGKVGASMPIMFGHILGWNFAGSHCYIKNKLQVFNLEAKFL